MFIVLKSVSLGIYTVAHVVTNLEITAANHSQSVLLEVLPFKFLHHQPFDNGGSFKCNY